MFDIKIITVFIMVIWLLINMPVLCEAFSKSTGLQCFELVIRILLEFSDI